LVSVLHLDPGTASIYQGDVTHPLAEVQAGKLLFVKYICKTP
jgi:hypothetical protein